MNNSEECGVKVAFFLIEEIAVFCVLLEKIQ